MAILGAQGAGGPLRRLALPGAAETARAGNGARMRRWGIILRLMKRLGWKLIRSTGLSDRLSGALLALCVAELALVGLTLWTVFEYRDAVAERGEARKLILALDSTILSLVDAQSGQRGYLNTGDERYLGPYRSAVARVDSSMAEVSKLVEKKGEERQRFEALVPVVAAMKADLARTFALPDAGVLAAGQGESLSDDIRAKVATMRSGAAKRGDESERRDQYLGNVLTASAGAVAVLSFGMVGALTFTLRRRVETESLRMAAVAKDEFVGFVSHELRGPIAVIAGNVRLLADKSETLEAEARVSLDEIKRGAERLEATVATLLNLAKAESGGLLEVEPVLIQRVAEGAVRHHHTRFPGRDVLLESAVSVPPVMADRNAIEQVLLNLLQNAEKHGDPIAPLRVAVDCQVDTVTVRVTNEGRQLGREQFERVFEPFFQLRSSATTSEGVGLGLTVCQRLVRAQGGTMAAEALPTGGASFSFSVAHGPDRGRGGLMRSKRREMSGPGTVCPS